MKYVALLSCRFVLLAVAVGVDARATEVDFINASRPTACAEEDNVYVKVQQPNSQPSSQTSSQRTGITSFRLRAVHPPYIANVTQDSTAPDFSHCDMSRDPTFPFTPRKVTLFEDAQIRLVGHTYASFWRPEVVDFRVGSRNEPGLHLVQLIQRRPQHDVEMLVVYPSDGYWRAKPLPPATLPDTAYGSSFLFGPIQEEGRPFVAIRQIDFDPATLTFRLIFRDGSKGSLQVAAATAEGIDLAFTLDPVGTNRPFAALRSMFVTTAQADVAQAIWPDKQSTPILEFTQKKSAQARFGRTQPSQHNLSAPDLIFDSFATTAAPPTPSIR